MDTLWWCLWWFYDDFMMIYGDFMVISWWFYGDFMVILWWFMVILWWFYGDLKEFNWWCNGISNHRLFLWVYVNWRDWAKYRVNLISAMNEKYGCVRGWGLPTHRQNRSQHPGGWWAPCNEKERLPRFQYEGCPTCQCMCMAACLCSYAKALQDTG